MDGNHTPLLTKENNNIGNGKKASILESPRNSVFCVMCVLVTLQSSMVPIGLQFGAINPTMTLMYSYCNETYQDRYNESIPHTTATTIVALMVSAIFAGGLVGALTLGLYANLLSRKGAMIMLNILNIFGVALVSIGGYCIPSYEAIILGRFLMGFVSGGGMNMIPIITSETSVKMRVPTYLTFIGVFLSASGLLGLILGYPQILGTAQLWPYLMALSAIPSIAYLLMSPWIPQNPYYLLRIGDSSAAFHLLQKLRVNSDETIKNEMAEIEKELNFVNEHYKAIPLRKMLTDSGNRKQLFTVLVVFMESQLCGVNGVGMYTNTIFVQVGIPESKVSYASTLVYLVQLVVAFLGSKAVERWGPRRVCIFWSWVMAVTMATLVLSISLVSKFPPISSYLGIVSLTVFVLAWASGPNVTLFPLVTALTTETSREACFKVGGTVFWVLSWVVSFLPPYIMTTSFRQLLFLPYAIFNAIFAIYFIFYIPETHLRSSRDIQRDLRTKFRFRKTILSEDDKSLHSTVI